MKKIFLTCFLPIFLQNCTSLNSKNLAHDFHYPSGWFHTQSYKASNVSYKKLPINEKKWWANFNDKTLNQIIEKVIKNNLDLKIAQQNLRQATYTATGQKSVLFPQLEATGGYNKAGSFTTSKQKTNQLSYSLSTSWEIDLFGVNRNLYNSKYYEQLQQGELLNNLLLSITAEAVSAYIDYRMNQQLKKISKENYEIQNKIYQLTLTQKKQGVASDLEVIQAYSSLISLESQIPAFNSNMVEARIKLEKLAGQFPGTLNKLLYKIQNIPHFNKKILISTPINVLRNRPDIKAAEYNLLSKTALKKSALNKYFPSLNLSGVLGESSYNFGAMNKMWSFGTSIVAPLINFGQIKSSVNYAKSAEKTAIINLEKTVMNSLAEVEQNVIHLKNAELSYKKFNLLNIEHKKLLNIANTQYKNSVSSFLNVLDAEKNLLNSSLNKIESQANFATKTVLLIKSLAYN